MPKILNAKGSLLFEALIALLILAVGVTASIRLFGQALQSSSRNFDQLRARRFLDNKLFSIYSGAGEILEEERSGEEEIPGKPEDKSLKFAWRLEPLMENEAAENVVVGKKEYARLKMAVAGPRDNPVFNTESVVTRQRSAA